MSTSQPFANGARFRAPLEGKPIVLSEPRGHYGKARVLQKHERTSSGLPVITRRERDVCTAPFEGSRPAIVRRSPFVRASAPAANVEWAWRTKRGLGETALGLDQLVDFSRTRISLSRPLVDYSKVRALISWWRRNNPMFVPRIERGVYLNVGCGPNIVKGFVNIDYNWRPGVDLVCDITRPLPFASGEVGGIYSEHCLEHLTLEGGKAFLAECARLLMPGGTLRLIVPDLEMYARAYVDGLDGRSPMLPNEHYVNSTGVNRPVALINELFFGPDHRFIYDFAALRELLSQLDFSQITRCSINQGADPRLLIDDIGHVSESLYLEARKQPVSTSGLVGGPPEQPISMSV